MSIPDAVQDKLDADPAWAIQHEDIVRVMDETGKEKPWSRYMIQQYLDGDPAKKTVQDRLDELVELEVLDKYEYSNQTLYDLAYDPVVTDGGRLNNADWIEIATFQDRNSVRDLTSGAMMLSLLFFGAGILLGVTPMSGDYVIAGNVFIDAAILLYLSAGVMILILVVIQRIEPWIPGSDPQDG